MSALAEFTTSPIDASCPTIPLPVSASVSRARVKPIIAARPFSCSEKKVKPCGIDLFSLSIAMRKLARRAGAAVKRADEKVDAEAATGECAERPSTGTADTKAISMLLSGSFGAGLVG